MVKQLKNEVLEQIKKAFDNFEIYDTGFIREATLEYHVTKSKANKYPYLEINGYGWNFHAEEAFNGGYAAVFGDNCHSDEDVCEFVFGIQQAIDELTKEGKLKNFVQKKSKKPKIKNFKWGGSDCFEFTTKLVYIKPVLAFRRLQEWLKTYADIDLRAEDFSMEYFRKTIDEDEPDSEPFYDYDDDISNGYACELANNGKHYHNMLNKLKKTYKDGDSVIVDKYQTEKITYAPSDEEQYGYIETCFNIIVIDSDGRVKAFIE